MHLKRMLRMTGAIVIASLFHAEAARAASVIIGTVVSAETKAPVPEVAVIASSPGFKGVRVVVTDTQGRYRMPELPPGSYTLRFAKEGFTAYSRSDFELRLEQTVRVNVELAPDSPTLPVAAVPPPATETGPTTTGMNVEESFFRYLAVNRPMDKGDVSRSFESLVELAPGAQRESYGVSINGASPFENAYAVDGLSTNDPVLGVNALPLSVEFLQEANIITGGYMPEYGRATGGLIRARTRAGSNEFHGSVFSVWAPGRLASAPTPTSGPTWTISGQNALANQGSFGATLGGPILKDRLWFFAGVVPGLTRVEHTRTLHARRPGPDGAEVPTPIPGSSRSFFAEQRSLQALGKLTYLFDSHHHVSLSVITTSASSGGEGALTVNPLTGGVRELINGNPESATQGVADSGFKLAAFNYSGAFMEKRLLIDANLGWSRQTVSRLPADGSRGDHGMAARSPLIYRVRRPLMYMEPSLDVTAWCGADSEEQLFRCPVADYEAGGMGLMSADTVDRYQANAQFAWRLELLGLHTVKAGVDVEHLEYERYRAVSGGVTVRGEPLQEPPRTGNLLGGFVQDSWTLADRITLHAGLRYDLQQVYKPGGPLVFVLGNQLTPRVGLSVAPLSNGQMKLFAHYAKYRGLLPFELMTRALPYEDRYQAYGTAVTSTQSFPRVPIDPDLVPTSSSELVTGAELEVPGKIRLSATYTHRDLDSVVEDLSRDDGNTFFLGNPGLGVAKHHFPKAERTYDAVTVALGRTFADGWLAQASYTWSRLDGSYSAPFRPTAGWGEPLLQSEVDLPSQMENRSGLLPNDRTHTVKVFGARQLDITRDLSVSIGLSYQGRSGTPINYLGAHPALGLGETFVLPRGSSGERTPWVHVIDSRAGVHYRLGGKVVSLNLEVFNVFDFQEATRVDEAYTRLVVLPLKTAVAPGQLSPEMIMRSNGVRLTSSDLNKDFKKPIQYQAPRQVRAALRFDF